MKVKAVLCTETGTKGDRYTARGRRVEEGRRSVGARRAARSADALDPRAWTTACPPTLRYNTYNSSGMLLLPIFWPQALLNRFLGSRIASLPHLVVAVIAVAAQCCYIAVLGSGWMRSDQEKLSWTSQTRQHFTHTRISSFNMPSARMFGSSDSAPSLDSLLNKDLYQGMKTFTKPGPASGTLNERARRC